MFRNLGEIDNLGWKNIFKKLKLAGLLFSYKFHIKKGIGKLTLLLSLYVKSPLLKLPLFEELFSKSYNPIEMVHVSNCSKFNVL